MSIVMMKVGKVAESNAFILNVQTDNAGTSANDQFTIQTDPLYTYDYDVSYDGQTLTGQTGDVTLTFPSGAGNYDIEITGVFPRIYFNNSQDKHKLLEVKQWGIYGIKTDSTFQNLQEKAFTGCVNLTSIANDVDNLNLTIDARD